MISKPPNNGPVNTAATVPLTVPATIPAPPAGTHRESGNVFVIVFIAVALFGALMFTFTRGGQQGGDNLSKRQAHLVATDIISYGQILSNGVQRVMRRQCSENDISFYAPDNAALAPYIRTNAAVENALPDTCRVFNKNGGSVDYQDITQSRPYITAAAFNAGNAVRDVGSCDSDDCGDLLYLVTLDGARNAAHALCVAINEELGITNPNGQPPTDADFDPDHRFTGSFVDGGPAIGDGANAPELHGKSAGCVREGTAHYYFYTVLWAR